MADYSQTVNLPDHKRGDRWIGVAQIGPILIDESTPADNLTRVRMTFRKRRSTQIFVIDSKADGDPARDATVTIDDAAEWEASIAAVQSFLPDAGIWDWDMEFWDAANTHPLTLYKGALTVHDDVSR